MMDTARPEAGPRIVSLPQLTAGGRWRTEAMRAHDQPVLYWFTRGTGRMTAQGVTRPYRPYDAILLPAGTMHGFETSMLTQGEALFLPQGIDIPDHPLHLTIEDPADQDQLTSQIAAIRAEIERADTGSALALGHLVGFLAIWLSRLAGDGWDTEQEVDGHTAESLSGAYSALLEENFRGGYTVADYARALGVSPAHLTRCCRRAAGRSASDFLLDRLHYEARRLLSETDMPIKEVAETLGFRSATYFSRAFRARTGVTPRDFRRRV